MLRSLRASGGALICVLLLAPRPLAAQASGEWDSGRIELTRERLQALLGRYEETAASDAHSPEFRARARYEATLIQARLQDGDFQVGDQIVLAVEDEARLSGTFTVSTRRGITLPVVGEIPLAGVLRSELQDHVRKSLGNFIRDPVVSTHSSIRILISGQVADPGFYVVGTQTLLSDALMLAGGPTPTARLTGIQVLRGMEPVWEGEALQMAIAEGRTIDQLNLRAGDHVVVPVEQPGGVGTVARLLLSGIPAVALVLTTLAQLF